MTENQPSAPQVLVTRLMNAAGAGDSRASAELLPLVYEELRKLAQARMDAEPRAGAGYTLQPTALVHEVYLRLVGDGNESWNSRGHFFGAAALAMRRILVDRARERSAVKRGGGRQRVELEDLAAPGEEPEPDEILALDEALDRLKALDRRGADVVMLRCFAGLSVEETAKALGVSEGTVKNDWKFSRAWLRHAVEQGAARGGPA